MAYNHKLPKKFDPVPKRHHFFAFFLFICGTLLPPIAVLCRFGVGHDLFINIIMTLCGYFPGHGHNFYVQNIRNNENKARTPKWVRKAGLVDPADENRRIAKQQWKKRFDERNNVSTHVGADLEEGERGDNYAPVDSREEERLARFRNEGLWRDADENFYNEDQAPNQRHHHYPMNFEGTVDEGRSGGATKSTGGGDRWERFRDSRHDSMDIRGTGGERDPITDAVIGGSYSNGSSNGNGYPREGATDHDVPEWGKDYGSKSKSKKSRNPLKMNKQSTKGMGGVTYNDVGNGIGNGGGGYGRGGYDDLGDRRNGGATYRNEGYGGSGGRAGGGVGTGAGGGQEKKKNSDPFDHEF